MRDDAEIDHYHVLGVPRDASRPEIRRAYRRLARRHHPDVNPQREGAGRFAEVAHAYEVLIDPARRDHYDSAVADRQPAAGEPRGARPSPPAGRAGYSSARRGILELSAEEDEHLARLPLVLTDSRGGVIVLPAGVGHGDELGVLHDGHPVVLTVRVQAKS